jgi:hypothetical protein
MSAETSPLIPWSRADLGDGRSLVVISGIALPEFSVNDDEHTNRQLCHLNLREPAERVEQSTDGSQCPNRDCSRLAAE